MVAKMYPPPTPKLNMEPENIWFAIEIFLYLEPGFQIPF